MRHLVYILLLLPVALIGQQQMLLSPAANGALLDVYSGASAAYSLRKLSAAYAGDAIEVRRSSDNSTQDIGFSGNALDESALTTFCSGTDCFVRTWYDQSGNGNDATQTTDAHQPQIVSSGTILTSNSNPTIRVTDPEGLELGASVSSATISIYFAFDADVSDTRHVLFSSNDTGDYGLSADSGSTATSISSDWGTPDIRHNGGAASWSTRQDVHADISTYSLVSVENANQSTWSAFNLGGYETPGTSLVDFAPTYDLYEFILYESDQSGNTSGIETNINNYYSIY